MARNIKSRAQSSSKVELALLCDGVRKEITGQETIVGLYADRFTSEQFPINFMPCLYVRLRFPRGGTYITQFKVHQNKDTQLLPIISVPILAEDEILSQTVVLGPIQIIIQSPGIVNFSIKVSEDDWQTIYKLDFLKGTFTIQPIKSSLAATV